MRNWKSLSSTIDGSRKEFGSDLKCENSSSTPQSIEESWIRNEQYAQDVIATSRKTKKSDAHYDYSELGPETNVNVIDDVIMIPVKDLSYSFYKGDDETEDQQFDKVSNVLDDRHIKESTDSNLSAIDATSQPIAVAGRPSTSTAAAAQTEVIYFQAIWHRHHGGAEE
ncbi:hypothetical protein K0M31_011079 [Melipona bicolor]|uniref:Uncharacterized protein n=1 Tax=Melipona bicolor TaxID=60889 RepID=A0AA40FKN4_9HYME|nr:hypothetical protein K0M31_011079 [Melipona bicolor]